MFAPAVFHGEDEPGQVLAFLGSEPGVFVEVGAFEPVHLSQTFQLETLGWRGILIEPLEEYAERLRLNRRASVYQVAAGAPEDDGCELPLVVAAGLSTLKPSIKQLGAQSTQTRTVKVRTLDSILLEAGIGRIDFVSIDVEGMELPVLRGFSLERFRPRLVLIEDDMHELDKHRHMRAAGYKLVRRTALNNWYVPEDMAFPVSAFGHWQLFRKAHLGLWPRRLKYAWRSRLGRHA